ncbi:hypothetical protein TL16_g06610 [Triparma laevis f. inornata]|uniref:Uncharacterized protein n=2 Tax=Triparma laevis TaxID=1534972 RepID=A0A9W7CHF7_9STRA|nr:hypothetical protein TL16_g06610 [Triparma laevis f. inornata]GMI04666.1 hypothetical protein TrLO_g1988 [Triparma laevis f. longispina]
MPPSSVATRVAAITSKKPGSASNLTQPHGSSQTDPFVFVLPLKPQNKKLDLNNLINFPMFLQQEYASKYLAKLGASPTDSNVDHLLKEMPIKNCKVDTVWRKDGSLLDAVVVQVHSNKAHKPTNIKNKHKHNNSPRKAPTNTYAQPDAPTPILKPATITQYNYTETQKSVIIRQLLLNMLCPLSVEDDEVKSAQELFIKKFPWATFAETTASSKTSPRGNQKPDKAKKKFDQKRRISMALSRANTGSPRSKLNRSNLLEQIGESNKDGKTSPAKSAMSNTLPDDGPRDQTSSLIRFLVSPSVLKLLSLTIHLVYWSFLYPLALNGLPPIILERARARRDELIADVTECDPGGSNIKHSSDFVALLGTMHLKDLKLSPLKGQQLETLVLQTTQAFASIRSELLLKFSSTATTLYLPVLILSIRNLCDNVFPLHYKYLTKQSQKFKEHGTWREIHSKITELFDPQGWHSHLTPFGITPPAIEKIDKLKLRTNSYSPRGADKGAGAKSKSRSEKFNSYYMDPNADFQYEKSARDYHLHRHREVTLTGGGGGSKSPRQHKPVARKDDRIDMNPKAVSTVLARTIPNPKSFSARGYMDDNDPVLAPTSRSALLKSLMLQTSKRYSKLGQTVKNKEFIKRSELLLDEVRGTDPEELRKYTLRRERKIRKGKVLNVGRWSN